MRHIRHSLTSYFRPHLKNRFHSEMRRFSCEKREARGADAMHRRRAVSGLQPKIPSLQQKWIFKMGSSRLLFFVRVEGESLWPVLVPGRRYLANAIGVVRIRDLAVFRNPKNKQEIFVKRVAGKQGGCYIMESAVSWGSSSSDFGPVPRELILGKIWV